MPGLPKLHDTLSRAGPVGLGASATKRPTPWGWVDTSANRDYACKTSRQNRPLAPIMQRRVRLHCTVCSVRGISLTSNLNLKTSIVHRSDESEGPSGTGYNVATKHKHSVRTLYGLPLLVDQFLDYE